MGGPTHVVTFFTPSNALVGSSDLPSYRHHRKMICHLVAKTKGPHRLNSSTQRLLQSIPVENERRLYLGFLYQLNIVMWVLLFMDGAKDSTI